MPVVFFIDPAIVDAKELQGVSTITLSYTFFKIDEAEETAGISPADTEPTSSGLDTERPAKSDNRG